MKEAQWHRSFRDQMIECKKTGDQFLVQDSFSDHQTIVCVRFKTSCHSGVCRHKRINIEAKEGE